MARKITDIWPVLSLTPVQPGRGWTHEEALEAYRELSDLIKSRLAPAVSFKLEIGYDLSNDARCEHCNSTWTEASPDYNGGCCAKDIEPARADALDERGSAQ